MHLSIGTAASRTDSRFEIRPDFNFRRQIVLQRSEFWTENRRGQEGKGPPPPHRQGERHRQTRPSPCPRCACPSSSA